jgi:hypothetical protein
MSHILEKYCPKCKKDKPLSDFHKRQAAKDGLQAYCKLCTPKTKYNASRATKNHYKRHYSLSMEQVNELHSNGCQACGSTENLHIDHDHSTGKVRGCLCSNCNLALGHAQDNPDILRKLADYIEASY